VPALVEAEPVVSSLALASWASLSVVSSLSTIQPKTSAKNLSQTSFQSKYDFGFKIKTAEQYFKTTI